MVAVIFLQHGRLKVFFFTYQTENLIRNSYYHLHPEPVLNGSENNVPFAVICIKCAESIRHNKIPKNTIANKQILVLAVKLALIISQHKNCT